MHAFNNSLLFNIVDYNSYHFKQVEEALHVEHKLTAKLAKIKTYQGSVSKKRKSILNCDPWGTVIVQTQ